MCEERNRHPSSFPFSLFFASPWSGTPAYCLRASDGVLLWRFLAAAVDRRLLAFERLESVWPLHGSVLVQDGVLYCVAGRSMFLDGGLRLWRLDPETGHVLSVTVLDDEEVRRKLEEQEQALEGRRGAALWAVSARDGRRLAEHPLHSPPVFDGRVAAEGRLYMATMNGAVLCFSD